MHARHCCADWSSHDYAVPAAFQRFGLLEAFCTTSAERAAVAVSRRAGHVAPEVTG